MDACRITLGDSWREPVRSQRSGSNMGSFAAREASGLGASGRGAEARGGCFGGMRGTTSGLDPGCSLAEALQLYAS